MNEQRENRAVGCFGAIVGWIVLGLLTSCALHTADNPVMVLYFKTVEGSILGSTTALAMDWSKKKEFKRAARSCVIVGSLISVLYLFLFLMSGVSGKGLEATLEWGSVTFLWSLLLLISGVILRRK